MFVLESCQSGTEAIELLVEIFKMVNRTIRFALGIVICELRKTESSC